jgi:hypothetical protein
MHEADLARTMVAQTGGSEVYVVGDHKGGAIPRLVAIAGREYPGAARPRSSLLDCPRIRQVFRPAPAHVMTEFAEGKA